MIKEEFTDEELEYLNSINTFDHDVDYHDLSLEDYLVLEDKISSDLINSLEGSDYHDTEKTPLYQSTINKLAGFN